MEIKKKYGKKYLVTRWVIPFGAVAGMSTAYYMFLPLENEIGRFVFPFLAGFLIGCLFSRVLFHKYLKPEYYEENK